MILGNNCLRGNSVRVVLSPSVTDAVSRGFTRALQTDEVQNLKKEKVILPKIFTGNVQSEDQQVTSFVDENQGDNMFVPTVETNDDAYRVDSTLEKFLSRPVLIHSTTWTVAGSIDEYIEPWYLFLNNSVIKNKIENYNYISCNLRIKVLINASPFYYGCLGIFYRPLVDLDPCPIIDTVGYTGNLVAYSQRPHLWVYPSCSQGGSMLLPYLNYKKWLDLTVAQEVKDFGRLDIKTITDLKNANSVGGTDCDIQIYAWAEDVKVCGPTFSAALQSTTKKSGKGKTVRLANELESADHIEKEYDENPSISSIASTVSAAAAKAAALPAPVGTAAGAVSYAAGAVSKIAGLFGYTNTPVIDDVQGFKNLPFHGFSSAEISTPVDRLALDPKNILANNPIATGVADTDELNIMNFCARESYLTQFLWQATDAYDTLLWGSLVTPRLMRRDGASKYKWQLTPMAVPAYCFHQWRGNIVYRFRFICTQYHKGRVRITWDPNTDLTALTGTKVSNYNRIVDLSQETDVSIEVPWLAPTAYCTNGPGSSEYFGVTPPAPNHHFDNGQITLRVMTQQTSPVASADIVVMVSVYGRNMEFANPDKINNSFSAYELQSEDCYQDGITSEVLFEDKDTPDDLNEIYMGEAITSLSQYIKRTNYHGSIFYDANDISMIVVNKSMINRFPRYPGFDSDGLFQGKGELAPTSYFPYNFVNWTPLTWISQCFVGCRGSINWYVNASAGRAIPTVKGYRRVQGIVKADLSTTSQLANGSTKSQLVSFTVRNMESGESGLSLTNQFTQSALSINAPLYSQFKFRGVSSTHVTLGNSKDASDVDNLTFETAFTPELGYIQNGEVHLDMYASAGPDYNLVFFLNVPTLVEIASIPVGDPA